MDNVIDAKSRFARRGEIYPASEANETVFTRLRQLKRVPLKDRATLASGIGQLAAQISPNEPLDGARRIFILAGFENKWAKRKRLIRLPGEEDSEPGDYGSYEANGRMWAAVAAAAAKLLSPHAEGRVLEREQERLLRRMAVGTSLLPQQFTVPTEAGHASDLIAELANVLSHRIERETRLRDLWEILKASPFALERVYPETEVASNEVDLGGPVAEIHWGGPRSGYFSKDLRHFREWAFPIVRVGVIRRPLEGAIYVPPPHIRDALRDPYDWTAEGDGPNQTRIRRWLEAEGVKDQEYDPDSNFGWITMPIETTRSVYLQACPRGDGEIGLWMKVNEPFFDNFIPSVPGVDLVNLAYEARAPSTFWHEPFDLDEDDCYPDFGILAWPDWCSDLVAGTPFWHDGVIGVYDDTLPLFHMDFAGAPRTRREIAQPPCWFGDQWVSHKPSPDDWDFTPEGVGGWIDDAGNRELMTALFANSPGTSFLPLISQDADIDVPCRAGTIGEALLRNLAGSASGRLDELMIQQACAFIDAGTQFHRARIDRYRSKLRPLFER